MNGQKTKKKIRKQNKKYAKLLSHVGLCRKWAYYKTKNLCEKENGASDYFGEIWLAKTLWILEDWEKISKSKNSPEEKIIKNNTILDFNISEDKLKQMLRRKPYKRGKDPKTKQIWRMYIKGYETNDIIAMLKLPKEFVLRAKKRLIIELKKELRRTKNTKM